MSYLQDIESWAKTNTLRMWHRLALLMLKTWPCQGRDSETLEPGHIGSLRSALSQKYKVLILKLRWMEKFLHFAKSLAKCILTRGDGYYFLGHCLFLRHRLSHRTQNLMRNAEEEEEPTCSWAPSWPLSKHWVRCLSQHGEHIWGSDMGGGGPVGQKTAQDHGHCDRYGPSTLHDSRRPYHRCDDILWGTTDRF